MRDCATELVWRAAGRPDSGKPLTGRGGECVVCGCGCENGVRVKDAMGTTFASHGELAAQWSNLVCPACTWALSGKPPNTLRLWTVLYREDRWLRNGNEKAPDLGAWVCLTSKNDLSELVELLLSPPDCPWIASVAVSGQKHVLPFAGVNRGEPWKIRFESVDLPGNPARFARLLWSVGDLLCAGFWKRDLATGEPPTGRLLAGGLDLWRYHEGTLVRERGGHLLDLALMCVRKGEEDGIRRRAGKELERRGAAVVGD